ncbi:Glycerophosphoryl diester phosphodiesterase [Georgfuchsia toluolica]|uniref:Glycerophosphoryl diester phosphodiesterase n=1 Tax=Georgfuchsia toluolica TaxID=424218 RepID=A0A916N9Z5_9PROT|nr:glycerophosphodiester phosphodiesterase [Georgfuchsia toluolica]CAG4885284.1 Glycerophosphoryl diester phosphodiesterase [Georgfuchsia toluolica]
MWPYPRLIVHRLGGALAPENTLAGLAITARLGCMGVEFDVMLSKDGVPLVIHDETLERTTSGTGCVADHEADMLRQLDAGAKHHAAFAGEKIPTFAEVLDACQRHGILPNVEIKPARGFDVETAEATVRAVTEHWRGTTLPLLSSFSYAALERVRDIAPHLPRALEVVEIPADWQAQVRALGCVGFHASVEDNDLEMLRECRSHGLQMAIWTVNNRQQAEALFAAGMDAVFSDRPDLFPAE